MTIFSSPKMILCFAIQSVYSLVRTQSDVARSMISVTDVTRKARMGLETLLFNSGEMSFDFESPDPFSPSG